MLVEERLHAGRVLDILRDDAGASELPGLVRAETDNLTGVAAVEVVESVIARDAAGAGDEEGQALAQHGGVV